MANVTSHPAPCRRLLCHLIYHLIAASPKSIDSHSVRLTWSACGLVCAEESTSWIGSSESRAPTEGSPARSSSALPETCPGVTFPACHISPSTIVSPGGEHVPPVHGQWVICCCIS